MQRHHATDHQRADEQRHVEELLATEPQRLVELAVQLGPGDQAAAEGDRADDAADDCEDRHSERVGFTLRVLVELDRRNGRRRAAAHAVVERDHLRHVGHGDPLAAPPRQQRANYDGRDDQLVIGHSRIQERDQCGYEHASTGPQDAAARRHRRAHALEAHDEQDGGDEIARLYDEAAVESVEHQCDPFCLALAPLALNISSMRSVTT